MVSNGQSVVGCLKWRDVVKENSLCEMLDCFRLSGCAAFGGTLIPSKIFNVAFGIT